MFDRNRNKNNHHDDHNERRNTRPALDWQEVKKFKRGSTIGTINRAERQDGILVHSWCIGKEGRGQREGQVLKYLDCMEQDFSNAHEVLEDVEEWVKGDLAK